MSDTLSTQAIEQLLERLADLEEQELVATLAHKTDIELALAPVRDKLKQIDDFYAPSSNTRNETMANLRKQIVDATLLLECTVKSERLSAVWSKGRTSWDDRALQGYAKAHPELLEFRKQGAASVSIRKVSNGS